MKNVLIVYFSQTGQAKLAIDSVMGAFENNANYKTYYSLIKPKVPFPFPWKYTEFFDMFPETVQGIPCKLSFPQLTYLSNTI